jgi:hypothetical protein
MIRDIKRCGAIILTGALTLLAAVGCNSPVSVKKENSLKPELKVIDRGIVYNGRENPDRRSCAFPQVCAMPDGGILDLFWTYDNRTGQYLNIHARRSEPDYHWWTEIRNTGVPGPCDSTRYSRGKCVGFVSSGPGDGVTPTNSDPKVSA